MKFRAIFIVTVML